MGRSNDLKTLATSTHMAITYYLKIVVFDCPQLNAYWEKFHKYGKQEISFAEFATIFEENEYDVIIEPSALYWHEMAKHWPKTKFIQLTREIEGWCKSVV